MKECGPIPKLQIQVRMEKQMFVLGDLMEKEWDTGWHIVALTDRLAKGEEERSQMIG